MIFGPSKRELRFQLDACKKRAQADKEIIDDLIAQLRGKDKHIDDLRCQLDLVSSSLAKAKAHINQLRNAVGTVGKQVNQCNDVMARTKVWTE